MRRPMREKLACGMGVGESIHQDQKVADLGTFTYLPEKAPRETGQHSHDVGSAAS